MSVSRGSERLLNVPEDVVDVLQPDRHADHVGQNAGGTLLSDLWRDSSPEAYLGATMADVPNAFLVLGPNVLVYDSFIGLAEAQLGYIIDGLKKIKAGNIGRLSIRPDVQYILDPGAFSYRRTNDALALGGQVKMQF